MLYHIISYYCNPVIIPLTSDISSSINNISYHWYIITSVGPYRMRSSYLYSCRLWVSYLRKHVSNDRGLKSTIVAVGRHVSCWDRVEVETENRAGRRWIWGNQPTLWAWERSFETWQTQGTSGICVLSWAGSDMIKGEWMSHGVVRWAPSPETSSSCDPESGRFGLDGYGTELAVVGRAILAGGFVIAEDLFPVRIVGIIHGDKGITRGWWLYVH